MADDDLDEDVEVGADGKRPRKTCTLSPRTIRYLEKLAEVGTHGSKVALVMTRLIEEGVRQAIRDGFIDKSAA